MLWHSLPHRGLDREANLYRLRNLPKFLFRGWFRLLVALAVARVTQLPVLYGSLRAVRFTPDGRILDLGIVSCRVVTNAGADFIVDKLQAEAGFDEMKFHGYGTGVTAEAVGDTALVTELTTQYPTDNVRPTGSQAENGSNVYRTVGTLDPDADVTVAEHGIFDQASNAGGVLLDRSQFTGIALTGATGDTLQTTYDFTITSGS